MKSKELKNYNLPDNRLYNEVIEAKPIGLLFFIGLVGCILALSKAIIYGVSLFIFASLCLLFLPNRKIIEFYDDHMIVYNKARKDECNIIYYVDVLSWDYIVRVSSDELVINLIDGTIQRVSGFSKVEFERVLNKYLKDKKLVKRK